MWRFAILMFPMLTFTVSHALHLHTGLETNRSVGPPYMCTPSDDQIQGRVLTTMNIFLTLTAVKRSMSMGMLTMISPPLSDYAVVGVHGTTTYALESILKGIKVKMSSAERATGRSLLSDGFYMFSTGFRYMAEPKEITQIANHIVGEVRHYATESQKKLKTSATAPPGRGGNAAAKAAREKAKKANLPESWVEKVYVFLGVEKNSLDGMKGLVMDGSECDDAYEQAKQRQDEYR